MAEKIVSDASLDQIFRDARTHRTWQDHAVSDVLLQAVYDLAKMGPTSANCSPMRLVFLRSEAAKARLLPAMIAGNVEQTRLAPVTAIVAHDLEFYEQLPTLYPHTDARSWYLGKEKFSQETALRNGSLQGAYLIVAARALGLDCGPMSGFNNAAVDREFFPDGKIKSNFICNLGYGVDSALHPRDPRLSFDDACQVL